MYFLNYQIHKHLIQQNQKLLRFFEQFIHKIKFDQDHLYLLIIYIHLHPLPQMVIFNRCLLKLVLLVHRVLLVFVFQINDYVICILHVHNQVYLNHHFVQKGIFFQKYLVIVNLLHVLIVDHECQLFSILIII